MPRHKKNQSPGVDFTRVLSADVTQNVLSHYLPNPDVLSMYQTSKKLKDIFQVQQDTLKTLKCVVTGDVGALMALIKSNPGLLFKKGEVKAPRGQTYYNVSPYMMMKFLCDEVMIEKVRPFIPKRFNQVLEDQDAELGWGGSDLVKLDFDPMSVPSDDFNKICVFKTRVDLWDVLEPEDITFPLLENPDGLLYWKNAQGKVSFYYASRETQTVIPAFPVATTPEEHKALDAFKDSFDEMENNSARRSTNIEHQLIAKLMHHTLHRQGIDYSDAHGEHYCDSRTPFQLINCYRTSLRLYEEALHNDQWERAHYYWREGVGQAQGEEIWVLQRICEERRAPYLLPENLDEFKRGFVFYNYITKEYESVFNDGRLVESLGLNFAIYKGWAAPNSCTEGWFSMGAIDLIAVCRLVEDAKTKTTGLALESGQIHHPASGLKR